MGGFVEESLRRAGTLLDPLDDVVRHQHELVTRDDAFIGIHTPSELSDTTPARRRLVFDEFLRLQVLLQLRRARLAASASGISHEVRDEDFDVTPGTLTTPDDSLVRQFLAGHRYALTGAQRRALGDIARDLRGALPMHRLLQGDVGAGKTTVALAALLAVVDGGGQGVLMAPTEVLAEQHAVSLSRDVAELTRPDPHVLGGTRPLRVALLTSKVKPIDRRRTLEALERGSIDIVVGTHALLSDDVRFAALGLVVIDEQHRFGVEQRATLREKGRSHSALGRDPDLLVMTATPIPRTAALVLFGDLDLTVIDELPGGRQPIATMWPRTAEDSARVWATVRDQVADGHRAFVVCPLVDGSEKVEAASAVKEYERLAREELQGLRVGLLHGQLKDVDKELTMERFRRGDLDVLVATTVIEVGVDVPEATVMVIEDAWRFGIAQLHQLRGRVGRGTAASFCFLLGEPTSDDGVARLEALVESRDGFYLAEVDLDLRGEGTLLGARQRGRSDLRLASLARDGELLEAAKSVAEAMVADSPTLEAHPDLIDELRLFVDEEEAAYLFKS
jgi:ATP-dependent DNA helicase RecG